MIVLGIDPGYAILGFGVIRSQNSRWSPCTYGVFRTQPQESIEKRLEGIFTELEALIREQKPDCLAVEELFFARNTTTAMGTAQARGIVLLAAARAGIPVYEYTPMQVKRAVTGYGRATKKQVQEMVQRLLHLPSLPRPDDAADALAVALCQAHTGLLQDFRAVSGYNDRESLGRLPNHGVSGKDN